MRKFILLILLFMGTTQLVLAQSPEALFDEYANHVMKGDFNQIARYLTAESRTNIKKVIDKALKAELKRKKGRLQQSLLGRKIKASEIASISAETYTTGLLNFIASSSQSQGFSFEKYEILGKVDETESLAHILVRVFIKGADSGFDNVQIFSFDKSNDGWGMQIPQTVKQMLLIIESGSQR